MKRLLSAILLLVTLFSLCLWESRKTDRLTAGLADTLTVSQQLYAAGDVVSAEKALVSAEAHWRTESPFTQFFWRQSEVDAVDECFAEAFAALADGHPDDKKLRMHLEGIRRMEHIHWDSVF